MSEINWEKLRTDELLGKSPEKPKEENSDKESVEEDKNTNTDFDLNNDGVFDAKDKSIAGRVLRAKKPRKTKSKR